MRKDLEQYAHLMDFLTTTLGKMFEAGIFDMTDPEYPIAAAANGHKKVQEMARAFVAEAAESKMAQVNGYIVNHPLVLDHNKIVKLSVYFIRDEAGDTVGALWLCMRCDMLIKMDSFIWDLMRFNLDDIDSEEVESRKEGRREVSLDCITEVISEFGVESGRTSLSERQEIICDLYDMGVFELKGAVAKTAEALQISEQTVYRYITKIRKARDW